MVKVLELFVLSLAVCSVTCLSVQPQIVAIDENEFRSPIDDSLRNLLENLRYSLRCGFPDQGIPSLAPFYIKSADVNERGLLYNVRGNVRDFTVSGLDGYTVDVATLNVLTLRWSVGLTFPKVSLSSFYDFDALLLRFIPLYGHGRLHFDVNDVPIQANGRISLNIRTGRLNLTSLDVDINMGSTFSDCTGVYDSRIVSTLFNIAVERTVRDVFDNNKANLETSLENLLIPLANQYLNELTLQDLLNLIGGGSNGADVPRLDGDTGELICHANEEHPTSEYIPTVDTTKSANPTSPNEPTTTVDDKGIESDDFYDSNDDELKNIVMKVLQKAFKEV